MKSYIFFFSLCCLSFTSGKNDLSVGTKKGFKKDNINFALELYRWAQNPDETQRQNSILSPVSISIALGMLMNGASGASRDQIKAKIGSSLASQREINSAYHWLMRKLTRDQRGDNYKLHSANALFIKEGFQLAQEFLDHVTQRFLGEVQVKDFGARAQEARQEINDWVEDKTNDKITQLLPEGSIDSLTALVLVNAIYFKADWEDPFTSGAEVVQAPFYSLADTGTGKMVQMMTKTIRVKYFEDDTIQAIAIPYKSGKVAMHIVLPKTRGALVDMEWSLTQDRLEQIQEGLESQRIQVTMPKFNISQDLPLKDILMNMGINDIFGGQADLSKLTNGPNNLYVSDAFHKAFIEVNEKGTEAAAATGIVVMARSGRPRQRKQFKADHPFIFFIHHQAAGQILFLGSLVDV